MDAIKHIDLAEVKELEAAMIDWIGQTDRDPLAIALASEGVATHYRKLAIADSAMYELDGVNEAAKNPIQ